MTFGGVVRYVAALVVAVMVLRGGYASANRRVAELTRTLASSSNEKARLSAVVALAKIGTKATLKPLVGALGDPSAKIRVVAAVALGRLGHKAALPALRNAAKDDANGGVRARARTAAIAVARANQLPHPFERTATVRRRRPRAGFGNKPRALHARPEVYVVIKSSSDDSPGRTDRVARKRHAEIIRHSLAEQCRAAANVTSQAAVAARYGLALRSIDLSVVKLAVARRGGYVEVEAQLRLAVSDDEGKMLSFLSGGAKVQVSTRTFHASQLPQMRREALENAMRGMFDKLLAHLREPPKA